MRLGLIQSVRLNPSGVLSMRLSLLPALICFVFFGGVHEQAAAKGWEFDFRAQSGRGGGGGARGRGVSLLHLLPAGRGAGGKFPEGRASEPADVAACSR